MKICNTVDYFVCPECQGVFTVRVAHCLECDHHYPPEDGYCSNCHTSLRGAPRATKVRKSKAHDGLLKLEEVAK